MRLSFSTRGWAHLNWEEWLESATEMDFEGLEVYNLPKFPALRGPLWRGVYNFTQISDPPEFFYVNTIKKHRKLNILD